MAAEGQEGPARLAVHHMRVTRRPASGIDRDAVGKLLALVAGHAHLAHRDGARRHVEEQGRLPVGAGQGDAHRVGGEAGIGPPEWRDETSVIGHVDEVQGDKPGGGGQLAIGADAADVMRVRQCHGDDTGLAAARDGGRHGLARHDAPVAAAAVEHEDGAVILHQLARVFGTTRPACQCRT